EGPQELARRIVQIAHDPGHVADRRIDLRILALPEPDDRLEARRVGVEVTGGRTGDQVDEIAPPTRAEALELRDVLLVLTLRGEGDAQDPRGRQLSEIEPDPTDDEGAVGPARRLAV